MTILSTPIITGSLCSPWMEFGAGSILEYLHTRRITPRSEQFLKSSDLLADSLFSSPRALLATIRNNGDHPCPRCLIQKADIHKMGQLLDKRNRLTAARSYIGDVIRTARSFIYKLGLNVASAAVERLLFINSWVPTLVCTSTRRILPSFSFLYNRIHLQRSFGLTHLRCSLWTFYTSLS
jgi:hypothetical protein